MKIQALGLLTGACGEREKGEIFEMEREYAEGLIARGYAVEVIESTPPEKSGMSTDEE